MKTLTPIIVYYFILGAARGKEVCYEDLGCFSDDPPWARTFQRPVAKLPWSPDKIDTQFFLLTQPGEPKEPPDNQRQKRFQLQYLFIPDIQEDNFNCTWVE